MDDATRPGDTSLAQALSRAEQALDRIARATRAAGTDRQRDEALREKVRGVVAELDQLLAAAGTH